MKSNFDIFEDKKLYKSTEARKRLGFSIYLWEKEKRNIPSINVGSQKKAYLYFNGKDLNSYLRMRVN
jgi:hypothetical protein